MPNQDNHADRGTSGKPGSAQLVVLHDRCQCGSHDAYVIVVIFATRRTIAELTEAATTVASQVPGISESDIDEEKARLSFSLQKPFNNSLDAVATAQNVRQALQLGDVPLERRSRGGVLNAPQQQRFGSAGWPVNALRGASATNTNGGAHHSRWHNS